MKVQMIQASIYAPSGRQGIVSAGFVSPRTVTILAPSWPHVDRLRRLLVSGFATVFTSTVEML